MPELTIRTFHADDLPAMTEIMRRALAACPDRDMPDMRFCFHPAFADGRNILCALAGERVLGFAQIFPWAVPEGEAPRRIMLEIKADPDSDMTAVKDRLFTHTMARCREIAVDTPERPVEAYACYFTTGEKSIAFFRERGFTPEPGIILLRRVLADLPALPPTPEGIAIRQWRPQGDDAMLRAWLHAHNAILPGNSEDFAGITSYLHAPFGPTVTTFTAFAGHDIVGSIFIWHEVDGTGKIERLFVHPAYRRGGLARTLVRHALHHFSAAGLSHAGLDTSSDNTAARALYAGEGFEIVREVAMVSRQVSA